MQLHCTLLRAHPLHAVRSKTGSLKSALHCRNQVRASVLVCVLELVFVRVCMLKSVRDIGGEFHENLRQCPTQKRPVASEKKESFPTLLPRLDEPTEGVKQEWDLMYYSSRHAKDFSCCIQSNRLIASRNLHEGAAPVNSSAPLSVYIQLYV